MVRGGEAPSFLLNLHTDMRLTKKMRKKLMDRTVDDVIVPDYVVLTFAVCATDPDACGWGGWLLEGAMRISAEKTGRLQNGDDSIPAVTLQICPNCRGELFRTDTAQVFDGSGPAAVRFKNSSS